MSGCSMVMSLSPLVAHMLIGEATACPPLPPFAGWGFLGAAALGLLAQVLARRRVHPLWEAAFALGPLLLAALGVLTLRRVPWHCRVGAIFGDHVIIRLVGFVVAAAGLLFALALLAQLQWGMASRRWPTVAGRVVSADVRTFSTPRGTVYEPRITYTYTVGATAYRGRRVAFGRSAYPREQEARAVAARYGAGTALRVHYAPRNPRLSVLEPGVQAPVPLAGLAVAALFIGVAGLFLLLVPITP